MSSSDTGDEDAEYEAPASKTPKSASKTKAASKARQLIYKSYRVDPQRLAKLDLELINDITECYDHDETAIEHIEVALGTATPTSKTSSTSATATRPCRES